MTRIFRTIKDLPGQRLYAKEIQSASLTLFDVYQLEAIQKANDTKSLFALYDTLLDCSVYDLLWEDIKYYSHWLRDISFPFTKLVIEGKCKTCGEVYTSPFAITDLEYDNLPDDITADLCAIKLSNDKVINLKYQRCADTMICLLLKDYLQTIPLKYLAMCICSEGEQFLSDIFYEMNGKTYEKLNIDKTKLTKFMDLFKERLVFLSELTAEDFLLLKEANTMMQFGMKPYVTKQCPHCLEGDRLPLPDDDLCWFLSSVKYGQPSRDRILLNQKSWNPSKQRNGDESVPMDEKQGSKTDRRKPKQSIKFNLED